MSWLKGAQALPLPGMQPMACCDCITEQQRFKFTSQIAVTGKILGNVSVAHSTFKSVTNGTNKSWSALNWRPSLPPAQKAALQLSGYELPAHQRSARQVFFNLETRMRISPIQSRTSGKDENF